MIDHFEIFDVEVKPPILVVTPQGSTLQFKYNNVQIESNKVLALIHPPEIRNVIVDLAQVDYLDSIIISALIRLLQHSTQIGGRAVICNASENMQTILQNINLASLWPLLESRDAAIEHINSN